ncbi:hypothetical protein AHOG_22220 [Actinoalloteichus hoggarensis]|uniref:Uncharacterized protein n=1 Tax=Actinoalloteichus hoggarensis TaxID=1470176 RepID=A0A221W812_9PSEU|nr:hypothetical protein AHOG_22220 [Actinoalloteichus hoggarensis]
MFSVASRIVAGAVLTGAVLIGAATPAAADDTVTSPADHSGSGRGVMVNLDEYLDGDAYRDGAHVIKVPVSIVASYESSPMFDFSGAGPEFSGLFGG